MPKIISERCELVMVKLRDINCSSPVFFETVFTYLLTYIPTTCCTDCVCVSAAESDSTNRPVWRYGFAGTSRLERESGSACSCESVNRTGWLVLLVTSGWRRWTVRSTWLHRHTDKHTDWQTDTQTDRLTHRQTHRHTNRQTNRQTDRHTDSQTHRQTDRLTDWLTDSQTDRHTQTDTQTPKQTHRLTNTDSQSHKQTHRLTDTQTRTQTDKHTEQLKSPLQWMDEEDSCLTSAAEEFCPAYEPGVQTSCRAVL